MSDRSPLVTTILPSYNHAAYVEAAVRSVWAQDYAPHELVAIDDGSADGSAEILRRLEAESPIPMRVIARENRGLSRTLNEGIALSQAPYINVCPSDDVLAPNKLRDLVGALDAADAHVGLAFGDRRMVDVDGRAVRVKRSRYEPSGRGAFYDVLTRRIFIPAPAVVYRRSVFERVGGFREDVMLEDWEVFLRITALYRVVYVPGVMVDYRQHPTQINRVYVDRLARERLGIFEGWIGKAPDLDDPELLRRARAQLYAFTGGTYYGTRHMQNARRWLAKSLALRPRHRGTWSLFLRSLLGKTVLDSAQSVRSATRS